MSLNRYVMIVTGVRVCAGKSDMTKDEAIELAYEVAMTENWTWIEPVSAHRFRRRLIGPLVWRVLTNIHFRGMNVRLLINDATGEVIQKGYLPR